MDGVVRKNRAACRWTRRGDCLGGLLLLFFVRVNQVLVRLWTRAMPHGRRSVLVFRGSAKCLTGCSALLGGSLGWIVRVQRRCDGFCRLHWREGGDGLDEILFCAE